MTDRAHLRREAVKALTSIAKDQLPNSDQGILTIKVRDGEDRPVFHATLTLASDWLEVDSSAP